MTPEQKEQVCRALFSKQDFGGKSVELAVESVKLGLEWPTPDHLTAYLVEAINNVDDRSEYDDAVDEISNDIEYAINQFKRALSGIEELPEEVN